MTVQFDAGTAPAYAAVSSVLWTERETLEHLLYKLVTEQLVLTSGATRWLNLADAEVRGALDRLRASEVIRAAEVDALVLACGMPAETTLEQLAELAPEPWPTVLADHRSALRSLVFEIEAVAAENRRLLDAGSKAIKETLDNLGTAVSSYDARGEARNTRSGPFFLDQQA